MENIRIDYLNTFLTVDKLHSFSLAAKELKTSQGTVSHHIAALETFFDAELFKRTAHGVEVTDAGAILKEAAERILKETQTAKANISSAKTVLSGTIKISAASVLEKQIIPILIAEFQDKHPEVKFKIKAQDSLTSFASLQSNDADFAALNSIDALGEKYECLQIGEEQLVFITAPNTKLAANKSIKLSEIVTYPFINRDVTSGTRLEIEKLLKDNKINPDTLKTKLELGSTCSVITAVSEGKGVSIIPSGDAAKAEKAGLIKAIPIVEAKKPYKLYLVRPKKAMLKPAEAFWEFCKQYKFNKSNP
ncbi:MAG: LysR family transcriptional regulator [Candidatus Bathyarchaeota archaeon]|nr:LysR family transcriptional regulator [Candidatus Bathyarchaeota archaeon]